MTLAPLQLPWDLPLMPEQFERVCQANPDAVLELAADGQLIATTPTGGETASRNQTLAALLWLAVRQSSTWWWSWPALPTRAPVA